MNGKPCNKCKFAELHELPSKSFNIKRFEVKCLKGNMENRKKYGYCMKWEHM